jgi:hypothetical protein
LKRHFLTTRLKEVDKALNQAKCLKSEHPKKTLAVTKDRFFSRQTQFFFSPKISEKISEKFINAVYAENFILKLFFSNRH